ncbi:leukocyte immunoglobulin-like receptor subfamily A member 2 isoform X2 [Mesocricetus auratus]|uniref:Leukocyte immunoglobulin-like receptor subfamily A member 2 isoform X2 n=1 Tax=Mesocricetus auratus TaxID=10036 RepID=A0ABM2WGJ2_MESAU|nr:leukocyte immunoglobulin-like receptor subfamily A member 2 isoform X2 [Mesocricetus auratus]
MSFSWVCPTVGTVSSVLCSVYVEILHEALPWALELLFLDLVVFLMDQSIWAQYGPPPQPYIWAVPGALIPTGSDVSIFCRTPPGVTTVRLYHYEPYGRWFDHTPEGAQEVFEFSLQRMTHENVGVYYCEYRKGGEWSQKSDLLNLVMTGVYKEKPSLTVDSGPQGFSERNVTLLCHTPHSFDTFIFCRGGNASLPQNCSSQSHNTFLISPVSPGHRRTYRCFGSTKNNSFFWSLPSDPLELSIPVSSASNYILDNRVRHIMAIFIVLTLGVLLLDAWKSRREPMGPLQSPKMRT